MSRPSSNCTVKKSELSFGSSLLLTLPFSSTFYLSDPYVVPLLGYYYHLPPESSQHRSPKQLPVRLRGALMPNEGSAKSGAKGPNRWEGTHTYTRGGAKKRTVGQIQQEAAARIKADREKRRIGVEKLRRNSIAGIPIGTSPAPAPSPGDAAAEEEEEFFDADDMPGSGKKKRQSSMEGGAAGAAGGTAAGGPQQGGEDSNMEVDRPCGIDPAMKAFLISIKTDINASTNAAVEKVNQRIGENEKAIEKLGENTAREVKKLREHVEESQTKLEARLDKKLKERDVAIDLKIGKAASAKAPINLSVNKSVAGGRREEAFHKSRRSLKMWPVDGEDLLDAVKNFMANKLKIEDGRIRELGIASVAPPPSKAARDRAEVLVVFEDRDDRDYVKSMGVNLAGDRSVGMAIHVPGHLLDNLHALNAVGYSIKEKNADKAVKRSVKFDDGTMDLFLDICIGGQWRRIFPNQAREAMKAVPAISNESNRNLSTGDLANLLQGDPLNSTGIVVIPDEGQ